MHLNGADCVLQFNFVVFFFLFFFFFVTVVAHKIWSVSIYSNLAVVNGEK